MDPKRTIVIGRIAVALFCLALASPALAGPKAVAPSGVVNINTATEGELIMLPGIGPSKAKAIMDYRKKRTFNATSDLIRVKGIGRKTYTKLKEMIITKGPTTMGSSTPAPATDGQN